MNIGQSVYKRSRYHGLVIDNIVSETKAYFKTEKGVFIDKKHGRERGTQGDTYGTDWWYEVNGENVDALKREVKIIKLKRIQREYGAIDFDKYKLTKEMADSIIEHHKAVDDILKQARS